MLKNSILSKRLWILGLLISIAVGIATYSAQSKNAKLSKVERKLFQSLKITPASLWIEAQDFTSELHTGQQVKLSDYRGRFVLLNFWATWCAPCLKEMPDMEKAYQKLGSDKLVVLAVGMGESKSRVKAFIEKHGFTFPMVTDLKMEITREYGVRNIPATFIIDPEGLVLGRALGVRDWANEDLLNFMEAKFE